jgi:hypothetical protein
MLIVEDGCNEGSCPTLIEQPGERWERQFRIVEAEVSGFAVYESYGKHPEGSHGWCYGDDAIACFTTEEDAERFISAVQFGQRFGHRAEYGGLIKSILPAYSHAVVRDRYDREEQERAARREKRRAARERKLANG